MGHGRHLEQGETRPPGVAVATSRFSRERSTRALENGATAECEREHGTPRDSHREVARSYMRQDIHARDRGGGAASEEHLQIVASSIALGV